MFCVWLASQCRACSPTARSWVCCFSFLAASSKHFIHHSSLSIQKSGTGEMALWTRVLLTRETESCANLQDCCRQVWYHRSHVVKGELILTICPLTFAWARAHNNFLKFKCKLHLTDEAGFLVVVLLWFWLFWLRGLFVYLLLLVWSDKTPNRDMETVMIFVHKQLTSMTSEDQFRHIPGLRILGLQKGRAGVLGQ